MGTIHIKHWHFLGREESKTCQICQQIAIKNGLHNGGDYGLKFMKFCQCLNWNIDLEKSIEYYTRGSHLKSHCQKKLDEAVLKLDEIKVSPDGKISKKK